MSSDINLQIRASIDQAKVIENETHSLKNYVALNIKTLHHCIHLPKQAPNDHLLAFLTRYIQHVPDFLEALVDLTQRAGIYQDINKIIDIAQAYFISPPELLKGHHGMHALLDEAYLAHRLIEEVNDRILAECGVPLMPMDMTRSNLVVHHLLGEDFGNQLDLAVHYSLEAFFKTQTTLIHNEKFVEYIELHKAHGWSDILREWPCLAGDSNIELQFRPMLGSAGPH